MISIPPDSASPGRAAPRFWLGMVCCFVLGGIGLLGGGAERLRGQEPVAASPEVRVPRQGMDRFDMRAAEEAEQSERLALVRTSFERRRWDEGVQQLQALLNAEQDSLVFGEDRVWRPISEVALELLLQLPGDAQQAYDSRFRGVAERELTRARQARDLAGISQVARRYLLTTAGQLASRELIDSAIDHGNCDAVSKQIRDLLRVGSPLLKDAHWRDQLVSVMQRTGHVGVANALSAHNANPRDAPVPSGEWNLDLLESERGWLNERFTISGSSTGQGVSRIEDSSMLPRWRLPLVSHPQVRHQLQEQSLKFEDEGTFGLSVLSTVGTEEVVVTRTFSRLTAVNAHTGRVMWSSRNWGKHTSDSGLPEDLSEEMLRSIEFPIERESDGILSYRLRNRLTSFGSLGTLSANSEAVFSLEYFPDEIPPLEDLVQSGFEESESGRTYLYARDLSSGKVMWRAGGPEAEEPPGLPAAGVFFFGPPSPDGDELFAVGEREGDILLFCLEAETGIVRWEQLLAAAGRRLNEDVARRSWAAPVAVRGSLVVCPTTTGWLTAVDRVSRRLLWSVRLVPRSAWDPDSQDSELTFDAPNREGSLDERWPPLQPLLLRDRVLVAPIEFPDEIGEVQPRLFCLDLNTGEKLWDLPKEQNVGVIGATEQWVYLFDRFSVRAVETHSGRPGWTCAIPESITGRPLLTQLGIVVPTPRQNMIRLTADTGQVIESGEFGQDSIPDQRRDSVLGTKSSPRLPPGNLISVGGRLISVSPTEMIAFEWTADEARWKAEAGTNGESALRWAQSLALRGQTSEAAQILRAAMTQAMDPPILMRMKRTLFAVLVTQIETELGTVEETPGLAEHVAEVHTLSASPEDRETVQRLEIDLALHAGDGNKVWHLLREAILQPLQFPMIVDDRVIHPESWLADRILLLSQHPDLAARDTIRATIQAGFEDLWKKTLSDRAGRERLRRLFAETPFSDPAELEDVLTLDNRGLALTKLQALTQSRDRLTALRAALLLIERLATPDWIAEARRRFALLPTESAWPKELREARPTLEKKLAEIQDVHSQPLPRWKSGEIDVLRHNETSREQNSELPLVWLGEPCEALERFFYFYDENLQTVILERADGTRYGELPLTSNHEDLSHERAPVVFVSGLNAYLMSESVIHAFSLPEKQLLWQRRTNQDASLAQYFIAGHQMDEGRLRHPPSHADFKSGRRMDANQNYFEGTNGRQLITRTRRGIEVLDALTGQVQWTMPRCPAETVRCDADRMYRLDKAQTEVYSIRSGRPLEAPDLEELKESLCSLDQVGFTTVREHPGDGLSWQIEGHHCQAQPLTGLKTSVQASWDEIDLVTLASHWKQVVKTDSWLGEGPPGRGVVIDAGEVQLIEWATGQVQQLGTATLVEPPAESVDKSELQYFARWDQSRLYVVSNVGPKLNEMDCPSVSLHGQLSVHSRDRLQREWSAALEGTLLTQTLRRFPYLPIVRLEELQVAGFACQRVHLTLLDAQTGQSVFELHTPTFGMGGSGCQYLPQSQWWNLYLAAERIQLRRRPAPAPP